MSDAQTVFVIDNDPDALQSAETLLATNGFDVRCFQTMKAFLDNVDVESVGCIITDLHIPDVDGVELQKILLLSRSTLTVIVVTGHADVELTVELMRRGAVSVLIKPCSPPALMDAVKRGLHRSWKLHRHVRQARDVERGLSQLTDQEREVMNGMIAGKTNKTVSQELGVCMRTVDRRRAKVLHKMQVASVGELGILLTKYGFYRSTSMAGLPMSTADVD